MVVGGVVLAIAATIFLTVRLSQDEGRPAAEPPTPSTSVAPGLTGAAAELVRLMEAGTKIAFDGRYTVSGSGAPGTVRLWSRPPHLRVDTELGSGAELRRTGLFSLPSGTVRCSSQADGPWTCKSQPDLPLGSGLLPEVFVAQLPQYSVEARVDRIADQEARCFALSNTTGQPGDLCVTPDGILLRVKSPTVTVELVALDRSPPPEQIFELPAPVS